MGDEIQLFGAIAVRPAVLPIIASFETATGLSVANKWELNPTVKAQIERGQPFDLVITNPNLVRDLTATGWVLAGSQVPFGRISMGVAAKAGGRAFRVDSIEAFEHALKNAKSIAYASDGTSGGYFTGLLERLGLAAEVRPKLVPILGGQTATSVARGEAELAVVPVTSILAAAPDVILIGPFPVQLQSHVDFDLAISAATNTGAARQLLNFLSSPDLDESLAATGIERRPKQT
ncbi:molybdate ABC transporter substrate-binding protein [Mesorhizobium muleiense]|uniref:Molybdate transport system substrate-binding protein n=1 Tax=Mesorhizobium muleiense TaxID=1004279 RepID=A0A1G9JHF2_9HYPH|nr:substrate-binding domain-containing protein [Mesorhizobium muleiense]MCF6098823.1 substrate-binding domain-containing protein [Mesorhizobium muleiense]SDL37019.1 molybdate transport system substrate-binding protein [Mesorhizobium muleiense]